MEQTGGYDFIWLAIAVEERTNLDWMDDEGRVVDVPALTGVACGGEFERAPCGWQAGERVGGAMRSHDGAA